MPQPVAVPRVPPSMSAGGQRAAPPAGPEGVTVQIQEEPVREHDGRVGVRTTVTASPGDDDDDDNCCEGSLKEKAIGCFPFTEWYKDYSKELFKMDFIAGLTVGCMLVPQGMAYAMLAGLDPIYGLYSSAFTLIIYSFFTTSRVQAIGPVAMDSLMTASVAGSILGGQIAGSGSGSADADAEYQAEYNKLVFVLSFFSGVIQIAFGLFHLGALVNFLSHSVMSGFTSAAAIIIGLSQFKHIFGLDVERQDYAWQTVLEICKNLGDTKPQVLPVSIVSCLLLYSMKWWKRNKFDAKNATTAQKAFKLFCDLSALVVTILMSLWAYGYRSNDVGIPIVGDKDIPSGPPPFNVPELGAFSDFGQILVGSLMIGLIGFIELIAIAQMYATKKGYKVDTNQEFTALGISNVVGSFFSAQPVGGSFSRTAVNAAAGAETPVSGFVTGCIIFLSLVALSPTFYYIPKATLAAIVEVAVIDLVKVEDFKEAWKVNRNDFAVMLVSFLMTLGLGVIAGIGTGAGLAIVIYLKQTAYPHIALLGQVRGTRFFKDLRRTEASEGIEQFDGISILRLDADIWFANSGYVKESVVDTVQKDGSKTLIIDCSACNRIDLSGLHVFATMLKDLEANKVQVLLAEPKEKLLKQLRRGGFGAIDKVLEKRLFSKTIDALAHAQGATDAAAEDRERTGDLQPLGGQLRTASWRQPEISRTENDPRDIPQDFFHVGKAKSLQPGKSNWHGL